MNKSYKMKKLYFLLIFFLLPCVVFSLSLVGPDAWFRINVMIDENTLPEGVRLVRNSDLRVEYGLENTDDLPIYLIKAASPATIPGDPIPQGFIPLFKLVSGKAYIRASAYNQNEADSEGYVLNIGGLDVFSRQAILDENFFKEYGIDIKNVYADNRPKNVKLPTQHPFELLAYYEGDIIKIKGTISYKFNEDYNHRQEAEAREFGKRFEGSSATKKNLPDSSWFYLILSALVVSYIFYILVIRKSR